MSGSSSTTKPRRWRLDIEYDGSDFAGWQLQDNARTVQGTIEEALAAILPGERPRIAAAGRTPASVRP
ncbi:MAG: hypothetical protein AAF602_08390, partial [Myxococcota bacterium]